MDFKKVNLFDQFNDCYLEVFYNLPFSEDQI